MMSGNKGLVNLGNTCYMNAAIQCLSHLLEFHPKNTSFYKEYTNHKKVDSELIDSWMDLQVSLWSNDSYDPVNPKRFLRAFIVECNKKNIIFRNFDQNDTEEFLNILLNFLHNSIKKSMNFKLCMHGGTEGHIKKLVIDNHNAWTKFFSKDYSYIIDKFYSQQLSITSCTECVYYTSNHEPLMNFQLEIPDGASTLYDCLDSYTRVSKLEVNNTWTCDKCKKSINPDRKLLLWNCPSVIIILLKRYTIAGKNNTYIEYPLELDVNGYVVNYNKNNCEYRLSGLCIQSGSLGGGHYYAICRNDLDGQWRVYNDTHVNVVEEDNVLKEKPYCLFYRRL